MDKKIIFDLIDEKKIKQLELINLACLPVVYSKSTYQNIVNLYLENSRFAYYNDIVVGAFVSRVEKRFQQDSCYILTIGVLEAYRRLKIGTTIINEIIKIMKKSVKGIYLHVQTSNQTAIQFYENLGFKIIEEVKNYYVDIEPADAYLLQKLINQE